MSEFELCILHRAVIKHQTADALLRLPTDGTSRTVLDYNAPVLVLKREMFAQIWKPWKQKKDENVTNKPTAATSAPLFPKVVALANEDRESETAIYDLAELIQHQPRDEKCLQATIPVHRPDTTSSYNMDGVLVQVSPIDSVSQNYTPAALQAHILRLCQYDVFPGHQWESQMYGTMCRDSYRPHMAKDV